jgi:hypothetical protein
VSALRPAGGATGRHCFFVQARYEDRWTTVALGASRGIAIEYAADVYRVTSTPRRGVPAQVRVISERTLRAESGDASVVRAYRDVSDEAIRIGRKLAEPAVR